MYTIGDLKKEYGLSRSTILYYDRIGLLKPSERTESNYRLYSEKDKEKLKSILQYRETGISLTDIIKLLEKNKTNISEILSERLNQIQVEIMYLKKQEEMIIAALMKEVNESENSPFDNQTWSDLLINIGYSEEDLFQWHKNFEKDSPKDHIAFLRALGIEEEKIEKFRKELAEK